MSNFNRRDFLKSALAAGVLAGTGGAIVAKAATRSATDWVPLGNSGVKVTRLAFGTGTFGGRIQSELGQEQFTKLVRYAYERGIRFFETADSYREMPQMLSTALKGLPRDSYKLMTKFRPKDSESPEASIERVRAALQTEYVDIVLLHCMRSPRWVEEMKARATRCPNRRRRRFCWRTARPAMDYCRCGLSLITSGSMSRCCV